MKKILLLCVLLCALFIPRPCSAQFSWLYPKIEESDSSPSGVATKFIFPASSLTQSGTEWTIDVVQAEADTLATVTGRGATTSTGLTLSGTNTITYITFPNPTTDLTATGIVDTFTVDSGASNTAFGQAYYLASDGEMDTADADAAATMPVWALAITTGTGASKSVLRRGLIRNDAWNWTIGGLIYGSCDPATTAGMTQTAPSGSGDQVQILGIAKTADIIDFDPCPVLVEID